MFEENDMFDIRRFEVGAIINNNRYIITTTNDIDVANAKYQDTVNSYRNSINHVIIFVFDYDKNTNISYYDSEVD